MLNQRQFMQLVKHEVETITINSMVKFVSYSYEGQVKIQLWLGGAKLPKNVYFFKGQTFFDFEEWTHASFKCYKDSILRELNVIDEVGVIS